MANTKVDILAYQRTSSIGMFFGEIYPVLAEACAMSSVSVFSLSALSWFFHAR